MCQILDLEETSEEKVKKVIGEKGLRAFINTLDDLGIEPQEIERIKALKEVIDAKEKEILNLEGVDVDGN